METMNTKIVKELPDNMTGHVVVFEDPLIVYKTEEKVEILKGKGVGNGDVKRIWIKRTGEKTECGFMRVHGGFGAYKVCSGRMLIGDFFETLKDVLDNKIYKAGNTKCYPDGYIPELFSEHEKL